MIIEKKVVVKKEVGFTGITLLSAEEAEALSPQQVKLPSFRRWWLRSPGSGFYVDKGDRDRACVAFVEFGKINRTGEFVNIRNGYAIRPALMIADPECSGLVPGDRFDLAGESWTVISGGYALMDDAVRDCDGHIEEMAFRKCTLDWSKKRAILYSRAPISFNEGVNDFETSDIKSFLDKWAERKGIVFESPERKAA